MPEWLCYTLTRLPPPFGAGWRGGAGSERVQAEREQGRKSNNRGRRKVRLEAGREAGRKALEEI